MHPLSVALVWHQHQPYYPDSVGGINPMPWVRLHGTKDYWGMAMHLREVPEVHATINFVPSLLAQILDYTDRGAEDEHLRISRRPADSLEEEDRIYLLDHFFMADAERMIRPYPRYLELYQQRGLAVDDAARAARRFTPQDVLDLQCWNNLAWIHPIAFEIDKDLAEFRAKGQHWSEDEKQWLLDKQLELLRQVIPLHRQLAARGQLELTTTPYYHPILPLLIDKRLARQAMPHVELPRRLESYAEDAVAQIRRAVEYHTRVFGSRPEGMWPSEGSVAQEIVPLVAAEGIRWIAGDEEILARSTDGWISRDSQGYVTNPHMLYRPWKVEEGGRSLQMIFRDHALSDQIGFHYQRYEPTQAADDLISKLEAIGRATSALDSQQSHLVSIILDGENCWEYYPNGGREFLRAFYERLARHKEIHPVRVRDFLRDDPPRDTVSRLFPGSWISHNFAIWIGHPACNRAWDLLSEAREVLVERAADPDLLPIDLERAWEELYIAQGSDWFWWFDASHSSSQDDLFDLLFRKHLQNLYMLLGQEPPAALLRPIAVDQRDRWPYTQPVGLLDVTLDGSETYFEWIAAGTYVPTTGRGTMSMAEATRVAKLHFGFDHERLYVRLDTHGPARQRLAGLEAVRLRFVEPPGFELVVQSPGDPRPQVELFHNEVPVSAAGTAAASGAILEVGILWHSLRRSPGAKLGFYVELVDGEMTIERLPHEGDIETKIPSPDYELMMWQA